MDKKKLEKLENIKNFIEEDNFAALNLYVEKIKPMVKNDEDFEEILADLSIKNYDQALALTEEFITELKGLNSEPDEESFDALPDFEGDDDFMYTDNDDLGDIGLDAFENDDFFDDKDDDYY